MKSHNNVKGTSNVFSLRTLFCFDAVVRNTDGPCSVQMFSGLTGELLGIVLMKEEFLKDLVAEFLFVLVSDEPLDIILFIMT